MFLFIDTETTGLPRAGVQPRIVSVAWVIADSAGVERIERALIVRPDGFRIPEEASRIHGITTERARAEGVPLAEALDALAGDVGTHRPTAVVAHNLPFDRPIIDAEYGRLGRPSPLQGLRGICTVALSQRRWPGQSATLANVHRRLLGTDMAEQHEARADVRACRLVYFGLLGTPEAAAAAGSMDLDRDRARAAKKAAALIARILAWAADNPAFDTGFVKNVEAQLAERGSLSAKQVDALKRIAKRFGV